MGGASPPHPRHDSRRRLEGRPGGGGSLIKFNYTPNEPYFIQPIQSSEEALFLSHLKGRQ
jgi:hypothetical protein